MNYLLSLVLLLVTACGPIIEVTKIGHEYVQDAHSRKWWGPNWQRVTYCWKLQDGYCPKEDTRVEVVNQIAMPAPGAQMAIAAVGSLPLALGVGLGLSHMQAARMTQSVVSQPYAGSAISTQYINGQIPSWLVKP